MIDQTPQEAAREAAIEKLVKGKIKMSEMTEPIKSNICSFCNGEKVIGIFPTGNPADACVAPCPECSDPEKSEPTAVEMSRVVWEWAGNCLEYRPDGQQESLTCVCGRGYDYHGAVPDLTDDANLGLLRPIELKAAAEFGRFRYSDYLLEVLGVGDLTHSVTASVEDVEANLTIKGDPYIFRRGEHYLKTFPVGHLTEIVRACGMCATASAAQRCRALFNLIVEARKEKG